MDGTAVTLKKSAGFKKGKYRINLESKGLTD